MLRLALQPSLAPRFLLPCGARSIPSRSAPSLCSAAVSRALSGSPASVALQRVLQLQQPRLPLSRPLQASKEQRTPPQWASLACVRMSTQRSTLCPDFSAVSVDVRKPSLELTLAALLLLAMTLVLLEDSVDAKEIAVSRRPVQSSEELEQIYQVGARPSCATRAYVSMFAVSPSCSALAQYAFSSFAGGDQRSAQAASRGSTGAPPGGLGPRPLHVLLASPIVPYYV
jgi:hypothetical protein